MASKCPTMPLLLSATALGLGGSFHFGFQLSTPNPAIDVFKRFLNESHKAHYGSYLSDGTYRTIWSIVLTLQSIGSVLGSIILVPMAERLGRKRALFISSIIVAVGLAMEAMSKKVNCWEIFALGRFLVGASSGLMLSLQPMYLSEVSPKKWRGLLGGTTAIFLELGFGLGAIVALPDLLGTDEYWPYMYASELILIFLFWLCLPVLPESPKYQIAKKRIDEAERALRFFGHPDVSASVREIEGEVRAQRDLASLGVLFRKPYLRRGMLLGFASFMIITFSGIFALDYFSTFLLKQVGLSDRAAAYATAGILCQTLVGGFVSSIIVDRVGRRPLVLVTICLMGVFNVSFMVFSLLYQKYQFQWCGYGCIASNVLFTLTFGLGPSVLQWVISSETVPQNARSSAQSLSYTVHRIISICVTCAFFPLQGAVGAYSLLMFIIPLPVLFFVFYLYLPETNQRTTVEIMRALGYKDDMESNGKDVKTVAGNHNLLKAA